MCLRWIAPVLLASSLLGASAAVAVGGPSGPPSELAALPAATEPRHDTVAVPEADAKALAYYRSGNRLWLVSQLFGLGFPLLLLASGFSARLRSRAQRMAPHWLGTIALYVLFYRALDWLVMRPLGFYGGYLRPHEYGLSTQTFAKWLRDSSIDLAVSSLLGVVVAIGLYTWIRKFPRRWWLGATASLIPFLLLVFLIQPLWIAPLNNKSCAGHLADLVQQILAKYQRAVIVGCRF
jgi:hypothetical protein